MKKILFVLLPLTAMLLASSCKKCFQCTNECVQCNITVGGNVFSETLCRDSFNTVAQYNAAIAADTGLGYVCSATTPTYDYQFCTNQAGKEPYPSYFNKGNKVTCHEK